MFEWMFKVASQTQGMLYICLVWLAIFLFLTSFGKFWKGLAIALCAGSVFASHLYPDMVGKIHVFQGVLALILIAGVIISWFR